jgi:hypothetical protein
LAGILSVFALAATLALGISHRPQSTNDPLDTVYSMLAAAREGDVASYLNHFTSTTAAVLRQTRREQGDSAFASYLRSSTASLEGVAVVERESMHGSIRVRVEYVYRDRTVRQDLLISQAGKDWRISNIEDEEPRTMPLPFGTLVR